MPAIKKKSKFLSIFSGGFFKPNSASTFDCFVFLWQMILKFVASLTKPFALSLSLSGIETGLAQAQHQHKKKLQQALVIMFLIEIIGRNIHPVITL